MTEPIAWSNWGSTTHHFGFREREIAGLLYWTEEHVGVRGEVGGPPMVGPAGWYLVAPWEPTKHIYLDPAEWPNAPVDELPDWDSEADDATQAATIRAARELATWALTVGWVDPSP